MTAKANNTSGAPYRRAKELCFYKKQNPALTWAEIGKYFEISGESARSIFRNWKAAFADENFVEDKNDKPILDGGFEKIFFPDKKEVQDVDWREFVTVAQSKTDLREKLKINQITATVEIKATKPIGVLYTGAVTWPVRP